MGKKVEEREEDNLLTFDWENDEADFFGLSNVTGDEIPKPEKKEEKSEEETEEDEEQQPEEPNFFEEDGDSEEEVEEEKEPTLQSSSDNYWGDVYRDFKEKGILRHVEIEEGEELTPEKIFELQQEDIELEISARLQSWAKEELDEDAQAFIKFKKNGGATEDFFKTYSSSNEAPNGDISNEDYQDRVIRYQLKSEGWDSDEIEDRIQYLTENNKKEQVAKRYDKKIKEVVKQQQEQLLRQSEAEKEARAEQERDFRDTIKNTLSETKEVSGIKFTEKDKTELYNFLTKKNHKISDTRSITGFQKKMSETFQDPSKMILLAKLISNDFDMSQFEKATITKKTKEIKSNLEQRRNLRPSNSGSSSLGSSLADLFN